MSRQACEEKALDEPSTRPPRAPSTKAMRNLTTIGGITNVGSGDGRKVNKR